MAIATLCELCDVYNITRYLNSSPLPKSFIFFSFYSSNLTEIYSLLLYKRVLFCFQYYSIGQRPEKHCGGEKLRDDDTNAYIPSISNIWISRKIIFYQADWKFLFSWSKMIKCIPAIWKYIFLQDIFSNQYKLMYWGSSNFMPASQTSVCHLPIKLNEKS